MTRMTFGSCGDLMRFDVHGRYGSNLVFPVWEVDVFRHAGMREITVEIAGAAAVVTESRA